MAAAEGRSFAEIIENVKSLLDDYDADDRGELEFS